ncbi:MAG TPA: sulfotransferase [Saprospiraceae bacterium]|nr:sulfotransferase [Saprospiraceae bacterium]
MQSIVFIGGDGRSGTTLLLRLVNEHPLIWISDESNFILRLIDLYGHAQVSTVSEVEKLIKELYSEKKFIDFGIEKSWLAKVLEKKLPLTVEEITNVILLKNAETHKPSAVIVGIKKPYYTQAPFKFDQFFSHAIFINILRDGRAVFNSKLKAIHSTSGEFFETDPFIAAMKWSNRIKSFHSFLTKYSNRAILLSYEKIIKDELEEMGKVWKFLGITPPPSRSKKGKLNIPPERKHLHPLVNEIPQENRIDAWEKELSKKQIRRFELIAANTLLKHGYELKSNFYYPIDYLVFIKFIISMYAKKVM